MPDATLEWGTVAAPARVSASKSDPENVYALAVVMLDNGQKARIFSEPDDPVLLALRKGDRVEVEAVWPSRRGARSHFYVVAPGCESRPDPRGGPSLRRAARRWAECYAAVEAECAALFAHLGPETASERMALAATAIFQTEATEAG